MVTYQIEERLARENCRDILYFAQKESLARSIDSNKAPAGRIYQRFLSGIGSRLISLGKSLSGMSSISPTPSAEKG